MEAIPIKSLLESLINVSEKAAVIARACRKDQDLFRLLVEEKGSEDKNKRFIQDFKTLADVLVQETIKHDLGLKFPGIENHVYGEESNKFTNQLGESVTVKVLESPDDTKGLIMNVLDDNVDAATLLAEAIHTDVTNLDAPDVDVEISLPIDGIGVWIDPIDSTNEYIYGKNGEHPENSIAPCGLACVCVLIGVYDACTGVPIMGVVNQPFTTWHEKSKVWSGSYFWGIHYQDLCSSSLPSLPSFPARKVIVTSSSEDKDLLLALKKEYDIIYTSGAGYKLLCVAQGLAVAYVLSKGSTFRWDSCAPHALLNSVGGGVVSYQRAIQTPRDSIPSALASLQLRYHNPEVQTDAVDRWRNSEGLIGYRDLDTLLNVVRLIHSGK